MHRDNSPLLQRVEMRQERMARTNSFVSRHSIYNVETETNSRIEKSAENSLINTTTSSRFFLTEKNSNGKNLQLKFQQMSLNQKLMESQLDGAFKCAMMDGENQQTKNQESSKKAVLANSFLMNEKMSPKLVSPNLKENKNSSPYLDIFGCKKLDFSGLKNKNKNNEMPTKKSNFVRKDSCSNKVTFLRRNLWSKFSMEKKIKIARKLLQILRKLEKCRLKISEIENQAIFPKCCFFLPNSNYFFQFVVANNCQAVIKMLRTQPNLVHQINKVI